MKGALRGESTNTFEELKVVHCLEHEGVHLFVPLGMRQVSVQVAQVL